jgi:hemoglobin
VIEPRFPVDRRDINRVVEKFYARVRQDPELSPIFGNHVTDWSPHEAKIAGFWANAILGDRSYSGNPMQVHMAAGDVRPEHFETWLSLFDQVISEELTPEVAVAWSALAHRIGQGLRFGLQNYAQPQDQVPNLRA